MRTCRINASPDQIKQIVETIKGANPDSLLVLPPVNPISVYSPTKKKKYHRITVELVIPEGALNSSADLTDFGVFAVLRIPEKHISEQYLVDKKKEDTTNAETETPQTT